MTSLKVTLAHYLCLPIVGKTLGRIFSNRIPAHGLIIDTHAVTDQTRASLFWGFYESAEVRFINRYLRTDRPVIELGSSLGVISCLIRRRLNPDQKLICVEPNPPMIPCIQSNLELNGFAYNTSVINFAIDYDQPEVSLILGHSNVTPKVAIGYPGDIQVQTITLSTLLIEQQIIGDYVLVIDIEGAEAGLIYRDRAALECCCQIIIEFHTTVYEQQEINPDDMIGMLLSYGYTLQDRYGPVCVFERK